MAAIYDNLSKYIRFQMTSLVSFIALFLIAAALDIAGGVPFTPQAVLWLNFAITVPIAIALGMDEPSPGLMERKPRRLGTPVLTRRQWVRLTVLGLIMAVGTLAARFVYDPSGVSPVAVAMSLSVFSLYNVFVGLSVRSETETAFNRDIVHDRRQLQLYGLALLLTLLATTMGFLQRAFGTTELSMRQWLVCAAISASVLVVDEVIKFFMRRSRSRRPGAAPTSEPAVVA